MTSKMSSAAPLQPSTHLLREKCLTCGTADLLQEKCLFCNTIDPHSAYTLSSPFSPTNSFDFTPQHYQAARQLIDEGEAKIHQINQYIDQITAHRDTLAQVVLDHRAYLPQYIACLMTSWYRSLKR